MGKNYWMFVGPPERYEVVKELGFTVYGVGLRYRRRAERMQPDDRVLFYVTKIRKWAATATITSRYFEDHKPIWQASNRSDAHPYHVKLAPDIVLDEQDYIDALILAPRLEYIKRWAPENWPLAFLDSLHLLPQRDFRLIEGEMKRTVSNFRRGAGGRRSRRRRTNVSQRPAQSFVANQTLEAPGEFVAETGAPEGQGVSVAETQVPQGPDLPVAETQVHEGQGVSVAETEVPEGPDLPVAETQVHEGQGVSVAETEVPEGPDLPVAETQVPEGPYVPVAETQVPEGPYVSVAETEVPEGQGVSVAETQVPERPYVPVAETRVPEGPYVPVAETQVPEVPEVSVAETNVPEGPDIPVAETEVPEGATQSDAEAQARGDPER